MYTIHQYSLKKYDITNTSISDSIYYSVKKYNNKRSNPNETEEIWDDINTLSPITSGANVVIELANDGVYKIVVYSDQDGSSILDTYIVHNITSLLEIRQYYLTKLLTEYRVDPKHHNQYYDFIAFSVLFETYNKLVKEYFIKTPSVSNLYMIDYLLSELQKYY